MERGEALVGAGGERRGHVLELGGGVGGVGELGERGTRAASAACLQGQRDCAQEPQSAREPGHGYLRHRSGGGDRVRRSNEGTTNGGGRIRPLRCRGPAAPARRCSNAARARPVTRRRKRRWAQMLANSVALTPSSR